MHDVKKRLLRKNVFIKQESVQELKAGRESRVNEVPVNALWNV